MTDTSSPTGMDRRTFLAGAGATAVAAGVAPGVATAQSDPFDGWLDDTPNYDGVADRTGEDEVTVTVGAGEGFTYDPPAIRVDPGTTVVWEWSGAGGSHDVSAADDSFASELTDEEGHTFERAFEEEGVSRYECTPHTAMGMRGAVVVGEDATTAASTGSTGIPLGAGVAASLAIIGAVTAGVSKWAKAGRDPSRL